MNRIDIDSHIAGADDALETALLALMSENDIDLLQRILLRAGAWASIGTRLRTIRAETETPSPTSDPRTYRDGMLAGLTLAADMCRAHQDAPEIVGDGVSPAEYIEPGPLADEIDRVAARIGGATG
mgnify:CR=1 FL=1